MDLSIGQANLETLQQQQQQSQTPVPPPPTSGSSLQTTLFKCNHCDFITENRIDIDLHFANLQPNSTDNDISFQPSHSTGIAAVAAGHAAAQTSAAVAYSTSSNTYSINEDGKSVNNDDITDDIMDDDALDDDMDTESVMIMCPLCQDSFCDKKLLENHVMSIHSVNSDGLSRLLQLVATSHWLNKKKQDNLNLSSSSSSTVSGASGQQIECTCCGTAYKTMTDLYLHAIDNEHYPVKNDLYYCLLKNCNLLNNQFININSLKQHFKDNHMTATISEEHTYKYCCKLCPLAFRTQDKLNQHSFYHTMRDPTKYNIYNRNFRSQIPLQKHIEQYYIQNTQNSDIIDDCAINNQISSSSPSMSSSIKNTDEVIDQSVENSVNLETIDFDQITNYNDLNVKYKCHKCRVGFQQQLNLLQHYKTALHCQNSNANSAAISVVNNLQPCPIETYLDPNRPFKCETCRESFSAKYILLLHYNSVSHLRKLENINNKSPLAEYLKMNDPNKIKNIWIGNADSDGSSTNKRKLSYDLCDSDYDSSKKQFKCDICNVAYIHGSTLDIHMCSVLHQTRARRLQELQLTNSDVSPLTTTSPSSSNILRAAGVDTAASSSLDFSRPNKLNIDSNNDNESGSPILSNEDLINSKKNSNLNNLIETTTNNNLNNITNNLNSNIINDNGENNEKIPLEILDKIPDKFKNHLKGVSSEQQEVPTVTQPVSILPTPTPSVVEVPNSETLRSDSHLLTRNVIEQQNMLTNHTGGDGRARRSNLRLNPIQMIYVMQFHHLLSHNFGASGRNVASNIPGGLLPTSSTSSSNNADSQNNISSTSTTNTPILSIAPSSVIPEIQLPIGVPTQQVQLLQQQVAAQPATAQVSNKQKRARTQITDEQLKILRAHFDINYLPSTESIMEISAKANLPIKVVKNWYRNTLYKERQRNKGLAYIFTMPPSTTLKLEEYDRTGQANVTTLLGSENCATASAVVDPPIIAVCEHLEKGNQQSSSSSLPLSPLNSSITTPFQQQQSLATQQQHQQIELGEHELYQLQLLQNQHQLHLVQQQLQFQQKQLQSNNMNRPISQPSRISSDRQDYQTSMIEQTPNDADQADTDNQSIVNQRPGSSNPVTDHEMSLYQPSIYYTNFETKLESGSSEILLRPQSPNSSLNDINDIINQQIESIPIYNITNIGNMRSSMRPPKKIQINKMFNIRFESSINASSSSTRRRKRAKRTRFTDFQIKVLQEYFRNNSYPPASDLRNLSKLLLLLRRVIVVWFQISETNLEDSQVTDNSESYDESAFDNTELIVPPPKKQRDLPADSSSIDFDDALNRFISAVNTNEPEKDEFDIFGQSIATQLRKLPEVHALQFMAAIQQQLTELRVRVINESTPKSFRTSSFEQPSQKYYSYPRSNDLRTRCKDVNYQPPISSLSFQHPSNLYYNKNASTEGPQTLLKTTVCPPSSISPTSSCERSIDFPEVTSLVSPVSSNSHSSSSSTNQFYNHPRTVQQVPVKAVKLIYPHHSTISQSKTPVRAIKFITKPAPQCSQSTLPQSSRSSASLSLSPSLMNEQTPFKPKPAPPFRTSNILNDAIQSADIEENAVF